MTLLETNVWYFSTQPGPFDLYHIGTPSQGLTVSSKLKANSVLRLPRVSNSKIQIIEQNSPLKPYLRIPFHIDYAYRDYYKESLPRDIYHIIKSLSLYEMVSMYGRARGPPSDKSVINGTAITFTKEHPLHLTHFLRKYNKFKIPLLWGTRMPNMRSIILNDKYYIQTLVLYRPWSFQHPVKQLEQTWEYAFYWKPSEFAMTVIDREQNYHDCKSIAQHSRIANTVTTTNEIFSPSVDTDTTTSNPFAVDSSLETQHNPRVVNAHMLRFFEVTSKHVIPVPDEITSQLHMYAILQQTIYNTPSPVDIQMSWQFRAASLINVHSQMLTTAPTAAQQSILLSAAFKWETIDIAQRRSHLSQYKSNNVILGNLSFSAVIAIHQLNNRQQIVFEIGAATLLRAHLFGTNASSNLSETLFTKLDSILNSKHQNLLFQTGCAGTGKSVSIHAINHFAQSWGIQHRLALTAYTGSAALGINGITLHTWAGLLPRAGQSSNSFMNTNQLPDLSQVALFIVDEVSLISSALFYQVHLQLQTRLKNDLPFGGISAIFSGDMAQLPPIGSTKCALYHRIPLTIDPTTMQSNSFQGQLLWRSITDVVILTKNYRAIKDPQFIAFLDSVRTNAHIKPEYLQKLRSRIITPDLLSISPPPVGATTIWYTNDDVNDTSSIMLHDNAKRLHQQVYRFPASIIDAQGSNIEFQHEIYANHLIGIPCGNNQKQLCIANLDLYIGAGVSLWREMNYCHMAYVMAVKEYLSILSHPYLT